MSSPAEIETLVADVSALTGSAPPAVLSEEAPVLREEAAANVYFVGLIGGKDVGKTSLVNALAGRTLAQPVGHGEGTKTVTAYAHRTAEAAVRRTLDDIAPGRYAVVAHEHDELLSQVLLDLPDVDSRYEDHIALTRRVLRVLLFPVWIQSVEKYADQRPMQLLEQVAEGNDPANFLFVLNKCDQLAAREGDEATNELAADYAQRLGRRLGLVEPPRVWRVAATQHDRFDLPELRTLLARQKSQQIVATSRQLAVRRKSSSMLRWVNEQDLPERAAAAARMHEEAADLLAERVAAPLLEIALPKLADDPAHKMAVADPAARRRLRAWPVVNVIDALMAPLIALVRKNLAPAGNESAGVDVYLAEAGRPLAKQVQAVFAHLNGAYPAVSELYASRHLWEPPAAETAAAELRGALAAATERQKALILERVRPPALLAPWRWLLTIGVILWFPIIQPILEALLVTTGDVVELDLLGAATTAVLLLSAQALLTNLGVVVLWLFILWAILRVGTHAKVARLRRSLARRTADDPDASWAAQVVRWMNDLLTPLARRRDQWRELVDRAERLQAPAAAPTRRASAA